MPGYTFRVFVTSRSDAPEEIWRDYNRRADMENRIAELKHDLGADGFCLKEFFATEAAFQAVLLLFNLLSEFQHAAGLPAYREPATLRTQVFTCGAILGRAGRRLVLHLSLAASEKDLRTFYHELLCRRGTDRTSGPEHYGTFVLQDC